MTTWEDADIIKGEVFQINEERGMVIVSLGDGYSVVELLSESLVEVGDDLKGRLECEGDEVILNLSKNTKMDVCVEGAWDDLASAKERAFL